MYESMSDRAAQDQGQVHVALEFTWKLHAFHEKAKKYLKPCFFVFPPPLHSLSQHFCSS